jgi:hypothetical protein
VIGTPPGSTVAWAPEDLPPAAEQLAAFSYVVLEEIVGRLALLRRWAWPEVDQFGRVLWLNGSDCDSGAAAIALDLLQAQLYTPNRLRRRPRCGDTFAVQGAAQAAWQAEEGVSDLRHLFAGSIYDISADAREAAKLAYQAGLGAVPAAESVDEEVRAQQADTLRVRAGRPLRALRIAAPPRGFQ